MGVETAMFYVCLMPSILLLMGSLLMRSVVMGIYAAIAFPGAITIARYASGKNPKIFVRLAHNFGFPKTFVNRSNLRSRSVTHKH